MTLMMSLLAGLLAAGAVVLMLRRTLLDVVFGVAILSQAVNLVMLVSSGWAEESRPPVLVEEGLATAAGTVSQVDPALYQDPLPQALILTAIVIGFALLGFLTVLAARAFETSGSHEVGELETEDAP